MKLISNFICSFFVVSVDLEAVGNESIAVSTGTSTVSLYCEMSLYIHPDQDLQWFNNGEMVADSDKHSISYGIGSGLGQFGGREIQPSRVSTLEIFQPQISDSGSYTCAINNTNMSVDIQLSVLAGNSKSISNAA